MINPIKTTTAPRRRKYDSTFKSEAVRNWLTSGKSATVVAQELGLSSDRLYDWRRRFGPAARPISKPSWTPPCARTATCASSATF